MKKFGTIAASCALLIAASACATTSSSEDVAENRTENQQSGSETRSSGTNCRRVEVSGSRMGHRVCD